MFFGSGEQHSSQISLVRATDYANISKRLNDAGELLKAGEPTALFQAILALKAVQSQTGSNEQAIALRTAIDERLSGEGQKVFYFLTTKKADLLVECPKTCARIEALLAGISFERLVAPDQEDYLFGLTVSLWQADDARRRETAESDNVYQAWLNQMKSVEKMIEPSRARSEKPGVGVPARG